MESTLLNKGNLLDFKLKNSFKKDLLKLSLDAEYDNLVKIDFINYNKKKDIVANINLDLIKQKEKLNIKRSNFKERNNQISISGVKFKKENFLL